MESYIFDASIVALTFNFSKNTTMNRENTSEFQFNDTHPYQLYLIKIGRNNL